MECEIKQSITKKNKCKYKFVSMRKTVIDNYKSKKSKLDRVKIEWIEQVIETVLTMVGNISSIIFGCDSRNFLT